MTVKIIYCLYKDSTRDIRSNIPLRLQEIPWALPSGDPSGEGVYLTVYPTSSPNTDTIYPLAWHNTNSLIEEEEKIMLPNFGKSEMPERRQPRYIYFIYSRQLFLVFSVGLKTDIPRGWGLISCKLWPSPWIGNQRCRGAKTENPLPFFQSGSHKTNFDALY